MFKSTSAYMRVKLPLLRNAAYQYNRNGAPIRTAFQQMLGKTEVRPKEE